MARRGRRSSPPNQKLVGALESSFVHDGKTFRDESAQPVTDSRLAELEKIRKILPSLTDRRYYLGGLRRLQGRDQRGRLQTKYTAEFSATQQRKNQCGMLGLIDTMKNLEDTTRKSLGGDKIALLINLMMNCGFRVGSKSKSIHIGALQLKSEAIKKIKTMEDGGGVEITFTGKSGATNRCTLSLKNNKELVKAILSIKAKEAYLFAYDYHDGAGITYSRVLKYMKNIASHFTPKNIRTYVANVMLLRIASGNLKRDIEVIAKQLNNLPATCRSSYLSEHVIEYVKKHGAQSDPAEKYKEILQANC